MDALSRSEARAREILRAHVGEAEAAKAAKVLVGLPRDVWNDLFRTREELAATVGISPSGVTHRENHRSSPEEARPVLVKHGAKGGRGFAAWFAPTALTYYEDYPPQNE